jgi:hypothetical protein
MFRAVRNCINFKSQFWAILGHIEDLQKSRREICGLSHDSDPTGLQGDARPAIPDTFEISENDKSQTRFQSRISMHDWE